MPDLYCGTCGEPWDLDYVLHEHDPDMKYKRGLIESCPCCPKPETARDGKLRKPRKLSRGEKNRAAMAKMLADVLGDDVDAIAVEGSEIGDL